MLRRVFPTLADTFAAAGYATGIFGKWHLGDNYPYRPQDRGFERAIWFPSSHIPSAPDYWKNDYFDTWLRDETGQIRQYKGYCTDIYFEEAMRWMSRQKESGQPFLAYLPLNAAHGPLFVPDKYRQPYKDQDRRVASFFGMITNIDENMGRLEAYLTEQNLRDDTVRAPKHIPWVLDVLDLLTVFAVQERTSLERLLSTVLSQCMQSARHLTQDHWQILRMICSDLNRVELFESYRQAVAEDFVPTGLDVNQPDPAIRLATQLQGKVVAVYTLNESVGQRVRAELTARFSQLDVRLNHEHDASDRLRSLAREADYFLVATRCAKHMATECIEQNRKPGGTTHYATGKGSSSLLAALYTHFEAA
jgi:hypothetical protein